MKKLLLLAPIFIYLAASTWANLDLFPEGFMEYWWFDDVSHIIVFGGLAVSLILLAETCWSRWWFGTVVSIVIAVGDEYSQQFISARAYTTHDLYMSLTGIGIASLGYWLIWWWKQERID